MDQRLHIIIAGESGKTVTLPLTTKKLCVVVTVSTIAFFLLTAASICTYSLYTKNCTISSKLSDVQERLRDSTVLISKNNRLIEKQRHELDLKVAKLKRNNIEQANAFKEEKETLLSAAVDELNERSELIERIFYNIGIKIPKNNGSNAKHSGGPFIEQPDTDKDKLLFKADKYLNAIQYLPLGKPVQGSISSGFGRRKDPINNKSAYHTGIDFRGSRGDRIFATASGVVKKAFRNGGYGNYVLLDHGNGYTSSYAHMLKYMVHKGDSVERGQLIGLIGNTGRSTGTHLHYEIALNKKPINPSKFLKVADLAKVVHIRRRNTKKKNALVLNKG